MFLILTLCRCQGRNQGNYQNQTQSIIINLLSCSNLRNFQWNYIKHFQHYSIILQTYYSLLLIASSFCPKNENSETALKKKIERNFARNFERNYFKKNWNFIFQNNSAKNILEYNKSKPPIKTQFHCFIPNLSK